MTTGLIDFPPSVTPETSDPQFYTGAVRLSAQELRYEIQVNEDAPDCWHARLFFSVSLPSVKPANRWARRKPTSKTVELTVWYDAVRPWKCTPRVVERWEASDEAMWFGTEATDQTREARLLVLLKALLAQA